MKKEERNVTESSSTNNSWSSAQITDNDSTQVLVLLFCRCVSAIKIFFNETQMWDYFMLIFRSLNPCRNHVMSCIMSMKGGEEEKKEEEEVRLGVGEY